MEGVLLPEEPVEGGEGEGDGAGLGAALAASFSCLNFVSILDKNRLEFKGIPYQT